jgi:hypothetical protein
LGNKTTSQAPSLKSMGRHKRVRLTTVTGEASYTDFKASGLFTTPFISLADDHYITKLEASQLNFQAGLEWRIYKGRFTPNLKALAVAGMILKSSQSRGPRNALR